VRSILLSWVIRYEIYCLDVVFILFCSPVFCQKLGLLLLSINFYLHDCKGKTTNNFTCFRLPCILIDVTGASDIAHRLQLEEISVKLLSLSSGKEGRASTLSSKKAFFLLLGKIKCKLYKFDVAESKYCNQNILSPTTFKRETFKFKKIVFNKKKFNVVLKLLCTVQNNEIVHSVEQKSIGLKFSKSPTGSDVRYSCLHNSSRFTFPIFSHSCCFSVLHSLQSITPRIY